MLFNQPELDNFKNKLILLFGKKFNKKIQQNLFVINLGNTGIELIMMEVFLIYFLNLKRRKKSNIDLLKIFV